jgi:hypothetical protein
VVRRKRKRLGQLLDGRQVDGEERRARGGAEEHPGLAIGLELVRTEQQQGRHLFPQDEVLRSPDGNDARLGTPPGFVELLGTRAKRGRAIEIEAAQKVRALQRLKRG